MTFLIKSGISFSPASQNSSMALSLCRDSSQDSSSLFQDSSPSVPRLGEVSIVCRDTFPLSQNSCPLCRVSCPLCRVSCPLCQISPLCQIFPHCAKTVPIVSSLPIVQIASARTKPGGKRCCGMDPWGLFHFTIYFHLMLNV